MTTFIGKYLNPGEVESLLGTERDGRRKRRLIQVRQQAREKASKIVISVKKERGRQLQELSNHLKAEWLKNKHKQVEELGQLYGQNLTSVGAAHSDIYKDIIAEERHVKKSEKDNLKTAARGVTALNELRIKQVKDAEHSVKQDALRKAVRTAENERALQIAALPPPPPPLPPPNTQRDKTSLSTGEKHFQLRSVQSSIHRGVPLQPNDLDLVKVIKMPATNELDAHLAAKLDEAKQAEATHKKMEEKIEQTKKERLRFLKAKSQLELQQDYNRIMHKLEELVKQEEVCSEPVLLFGIEKENSLLKEEQEAIVEELFSRLGLSLVDNEITRDSCVTSLMDSEADTATSSTNVESKTNESAVEDTPIVCIIAHDSSSTISQVSDSSPVVETGESSSLETGITTSNGMYANSYPMEGTTSISEASSKASGWSVMTPENATRERFSTSGSTGATNDETILAGHFRDRALDSSTNIPVLPSLDSSDSKLSPEISPVLPAEHQLSALEKKVIDANTINGSKKEQSDGFELHPQEISLIESGESKRKYDSSRSSTTQEKQVMHPLSPFEKDDGPKHSKDGIRQLQNGKLNIMDDSLRRLALTNLIANKNLGTFKDRAKRLDSRPRNKFCNVEVRQTNRTEARNLSYKSGIDSSNRTSVVLDQTQFSSLSSGLQKSLNHMPAKSEIRIQENKKVTGSISNASVTSVTSAIRFAQPSVSGLQMDFSSGLFNASGPSLATDAQSQCQFSFRPNLVNAHFGKLEPMRNLSTIAEMDTPNSSHHVCWQNSSTLSIANELESGKPFNPSYDMNEPGITDEPDLTLVGSECSTCSPNRSHVFDATGISSSAHSFTPMLDNKSITKYSVEDHNNQGHSLSSFKEPSYFWRELSCNENSPLDSYSTSVDSSEKKDWSTPTLSSSESHSCFTKDLQKLPNLSTPNLEFLSSSNPPFFRQNSYPSEIKSEVPSSGDDLVLPDLSRSYFTSTLDSTMENCTDSLLSFMAHERNADLAHLSTLDTICTDADTVTGNSTDSKTSNGRNALCQRYSFSQSESISDSMFSFLRHELSVNDSDVSSISKSSTLGHIS